MNDRLQLIENQFSENIVLTLGDFADFFNISVRSVQRLLKKWNFIRSYDHNGRYFSLTKLAEFDSYGIWEYNDIHFSRFGNLKQTLIAIISNSTMGMDALQIREVLGMEPRSFLSKYSDISQLRRKKIEGRYIYFSAEQRIFEDQLSRREKSLTTVNDSGLETTEAIRLLVTAIKHPDFTIQQLSKHLQREGGMIEPAVIKNFFSFYGIEKKTDLV